METSGASDNSNQSNTKVSVSEDILNVIQSGHVKTSISNKLSLLMDSSSEEDEEITAKKTNKNPSPVISNSNRKNKKLSLENEDDQGFLSDGYDFEFYGDFEDRSRLLAMTEVEREAILYERAQARQARQERRELEQRIKERDEGVKRGPTKEVDLKRKKLDELKAKRRRKQQKLSNEEGEEGEFEDEDDDSENESYDESDDDEIERKPLNNRHNNIKTIKRKFKSRKEDSDEDYYTEEEDFKGKNNKTKANKFTMDSANRDEYYENKNKNKNDVETKELDLDEANKLRLTRDILCQWIYRDGFEDLGQKCLLRINLGAGKNGQATYRVVELRKIVKYHRTYSIKPGTPTNLAAVVRFAKSERTFTLEFVSNSPFTENEFNFWKSECEKAGMKLPHNSFTAKRKIDKLKAFHREPLTDQLVACMLERRKKLSDAQAAPRNLLSERTILEQQLKEANEQLNNDEEISRIENELAAIAQRRQMTESVSIDRLSVMEDLNKRNRLVNLETGRQAEINRMQIELQLQQATDGIKSNNNNSSSINNRKPPTLDPFQRRKCKPTIIHMQDEEKEIEKTTESSENFIIEDERKNLENEIKIKVENDLFEVHDFDLNLEL